VKITDFGLVLLAADAAASSRLTAVGTALGTPVYMAPEQFSGGEVDQRADIYALGATAFHLLDGQPPFDATTLWQLISQKTKDGPPRLDELSAKISPASVELLAAMMAHDPSTRLRGYEELLQRIDRLPALLANTVPRFEAKTMPVPVASPTKTSPTSKRRRWYVAALIALLLLVAAGVLAGHWLPDFFAFRPLRPMMVASGNVQNLFDGVSLNGWQILAGSWTPARDTDKSNVLTGRGIIRRSLPSWPNYRVSFGIDLHHATSVDVLFGLTSGNSISPAGLALRLSPREVFLARRSKDGAEMEPLSPTLTLSASSDSDDGPVYREVRLERQGIAWWVYYDQKLVGSLPVVESEFTDFRLMVEPGPAIFVDIEVVELVQPQRE